MEIAEEKLEVNSRLFRINLLQLENAVVALANAVLLRAAELLAAARSWIARKQLNLCDNALAIGLSKIADLPRRRTLDFESIAFHVASDR